jgi:hypothetical protein
MSLCHPWILKESAPPGFPYMMLSRHCLYWFEKVTETLFTPCVLTILPASTPRSNSHLT